MALIETRDLMKIYRMGDQEVRALDGVSVTIQTGEFVSVVGPSGSGKSTFMNIIGCLDNMTSGTYLLDGLDIDDYSANGLARVRNEKIGFIFQGFNLLPKMTALENVELPLIYLGMSSGERHRRSRAALERVGLGERVRHRPTELSGGQQQRVAIARALANDPALILADEPTGNLDSKSGKDVLALLHELHDAGSTILLITHDNDVADQARRKIAISDGKIISDELVVSA